MQYRVENNDSFGEYVVDVAHVNAVVRRSAPSGHDVLQRQVGTVVRQDAAVRIGDANVAYPGIKGARQVNTVVAALHVVSEPGRNRKFQVQVFNADVGQVRPAGERCRQIVTDVVQQRI